MNEIICECEHSIKMHVNSIGTGPYRIGCGKCACNKPPELVETRHQLKQMTAERDTLKAKLDEIANIPLVQKYRAVLNERDELAKQLSEIEEKEGACCPEDIGFDEYIKILVKSRDEHICLWMDVKQERDALAKKLEMANKTISEIQKYHRPVVVENEHCPICTALISYENALAEIAKMDEEKK